jgi:hypothetical protein
MKLGFVFECSPGGGDIKVFQHILKLINPAFDFTANFHHAALKSKKELEKECGKEVKRLKSIGCQKIFVVWDLFPAWKEDGKPCRHDDKVAIIKSLTTHSLSPNDIIFLCIEKELESWLIADEQALKEFFITKNNLKDEITRVKNPDTHHDPKGLLSKYFKTYRGTRTFEPMIHTEPMLKKFTDVRNLRRSVSFKRFYFKLTGNVLK